MPEHLNKREQAKLEKAVREEKFIRSITLMMLKNDIEIPRGALAAIKAGHGARVPYDAVELRRMIRTAQARLRRYQRKYPDAKLPNV